MEGHVKKISNLRCAIQVSYVAVRQWLEILINRFLIKKSVGGDEWWWMVVVYFDWSWVVVDSGGWWWVVA